MADMDWGNTRAPMHPGQQPHFAGQMGQGAAPQGQYGQVPPHGYDPSHAAMHGGHQPQPMMAPPAQYPAPDHAQMHAQAQYPAQPHTAATYAPTAGGGGGALPPAASDGARFAPLVNYAGAAVSLALVVGLGVWGYQLAMRDVTGIPVVRALEGPMRVQPAEPGGLAAAHQGLAVNSVQASGEASAPSDRVALAPAPENLDEEDLPANPSAVADVAPQADAPQLEPIEVAAPAPAETIDMENLPVDPVAAALAIAEHISRDVQPLTDGSSSEEVTRTAAQSPVSLPKPAASSGPKVIPASVPGVSKSLRPTARPADLKTVVPTNAVATPVVPSTQESAPDAIPAGTRLVQLGAFDSAEVARAEWDKLSTRFEDYLPGKTRVVQKAQSGGKTFYRLRAMGFKDLADARRFCSALMAGKAACIPVVTR
ncbi:SPOR domain-containing protein [Aliiroseovarius crassostreae]|uniref:SPOR domain-containing protein n=1 Tax=Aliiroseovarius crassostreae TaxID=154981 RepID=UPI003C7E4EDB